MAGQGKDEESFNKSERQKMMEEILNDHYDELDENPTELARKRKVANGRTGIKYRKKSYLFTPSRSFACDLCKFKADSMQRLESHMKVHIETNGQQLEYEFFLPEVTLTPCIILASRNSLETKTYFKTNIYKRVTRSTLPSNLLDKVFPSEQFLFFIPEKMVNEMPKIKNWKNQVLRFNEVYGNMHVVEFPESTEYIYSADELEETLSFISEEKMIFLTETKFEKMQNQQISKRRFCEYLLAPYNVHYMQTSEAKVSSALTLKSQSEAYQCPMENCNFRSHKQFTGVRIHLTKHFQKQIRQNAKPKTDPEIEFEEIPSCLAKWVCSIHELEAAGDLVQHYGIFHCLVDRFFREYVLARLFGKTGMYKPNCCPYDNSVFASEDDLIEHLTVDHFSQLILNQVQDKVYFKKTENLSIEYRCPFCNRKFQNTGSDTRDVQALVRHCGAEHGYTFYHLMMSQLRGDIEESTIRLEIEKEVEVEADLKKEVLEEFGVEIFAPADKKLRGDGSDYSIKVEEPQEEFETISLTEEEFPEKDQEIDSSEELDNVDDNLMYNRFKHGGKKSNSKGTKTHAFSGIFKCDKCDYVDDTFSRLRYHKNTQHQTRKFTIENYIENIQVIDYGVEEKDRIFKAESSKKNSEKKSQIITGLGSRMDSNLIANFGQQNGFKFDCKFCDLKFSSTNDLRKHTAAQHDGYKNSCIPCQRTFVNSYSLKRHQMNYCCDSNFSASDYVITLPSSEKQNEIWHVCLLCQHNFSNKYSLRRHQRIMHEGRLGC